MLHYLLQTNDPDFPELFKVAAEFDDRLERTQNTHQKFAELLGGYGGGGESDAPAPHGRCASYRRKRASCRRLRATIDAYCAFGGYRPRSELLGRPKNGHDTVSADDIQKAIDARKRRVSRYSERIQEEILRDTILIDTTGSKVGQINGLAVSQIGETAFGKPSRITARLRIGTGKVLDVEREVESGRPPAFQRRYDPHQLPRLSLSGR